MGVSWVEELSSAVIRRRLIWRGLRPSEADRLIRDRDETWAREQIAKVLEGNWK